MSQIPFSYQSSSSGPYNIININLIINLGKWSHPTKDSRKWTRGKDTSPEVIDHHLTF